jgi:crotonobetainyl-CoA:carnitine CoA-transferase CaiB-like acyl-CoA transferase
MGYKPASGALEGLVVLDMTHVRAGPVCVRQLADWGANVVKIERPGDPPDFAGRKEGDFQNKHRNKRSMAINLKSEEGRKVLYAMVEKADVLVENFRPDIKTRLKFDYETLKKINPRLVYASISAFGQEGPYRERAGVDQIIQGMSGLMSITGKPRRHPHRRHLRRPLRRHGHPDGAPGTAQIRRRPVGPDVAVRIDDLLPRHPGGALSRRRCRRQAGRQ